MGFFVGLLREARAASLLKVDMPASVETTANAILATVEDEGHIRIPQTICSV